MSYSIIPINELIRKKGIQDLTDELIISRRGLIGQGGFANVFQYEYKTPREGTVAVKYLKNADHFHEHHKILKDFINEISTWAILDHKNVLKFHGVIYCKATDRFPSLVSTYLKNGNAKDYIYKRMADVNIMSLFEDFAEGLEYLHDKGVIHNDLKADNLLISDDGSLCISDFGISRLQQPECELSASTREINRVHRWKGPERLQNSGERRDYAPTKEGDIWSFGCTIMELISGQIPYFYEGNNAQVIIMMSQGTIPEIPTTFIRPEFERFRGYATTICHSCWVRNPKGRPTITSLRALISSLCSYVINQDPDGEKKVQERGTHGDSPVDKYHPSIESTSGNSYNPRHTESNHFPLFTNTIYSEPNNMWDRRNTSSIHSTLDPPYVPVDVNHRVYSYRESSATKTDTLKRPWEHITPPPSPTIRAALDSTNKKVLPLLTDKTVFPDLNVAYNPSATIMISNDLIHHAVCTMNGREYATGKARQKKAAMENAAREAVAKLYKDTPDRFTWLYEAFSELLTGYLIKCSLMGRIKFSEPRRSKINNDWYGEAYFDGIKICQSTGANKAVLHGNLAQEISKRWIADYKNAH